MWWYYALQGASSVLNVMSQYSDYSTQKGILKAQEKLYNQNADATIREGEKNVGKVARAGEQAHGTLMHDYGASGVDVNNSQTVNNANRVLQKGVSDDVFTTMYSSAKEAEQQRLNAVMARYNRRNLSTQYAYQSAGAFSSILAQGLRNGSVQGISKWLGFGK